MSLANRIKAFNRSLALQVPLPPGISAMNPYAESDIALTCSDAFYDKFYADDGQRRLILGINPGRFGSGLTGIAFTDFKRLRDVCGIDPQGHTSHEPSSEFIYRMIDALGGPHIFYSRFFINSVCPLGFICHKGNNRWVNYNYYDSPELFQAVKPFIVTQLQAQIGLGLCSDTVFCMGKKNAVYLNALNDAHGFFEKIVELPHPRFIVQYQRKHMEEHILAYVTALNSVPPSC